MRRSIQAEPSRLPPAGTRARLRGRSRSAPSRRREQRHAGTAPSTGPRDPRRTRLGSQDNPPRSHSWLRREAFAQIVRLEWILTDSIGLRHIFLLLNVSDLTQIAPLLHARAPECMIKALGQGQITFSHLKAPKTSFQSLVEVLELPCQGSGPNTGVTRTAVHEQRQALHTIQHSASTPQMHGLRGLSPRIGKTWQARNYARRWNV